MRTGIRRLLVGGTALFAIHCSGDLGLVVVGEAGDAGDAGDEAAASTDGGDDATTGGGRSVIVLPPLMDFGSVPCGTTSALPPSARTVSIESTRQQGFAWVATLARGSSSPYTLSAPAGTVAAGGTGTLVVSPLPVPSTSATTSGLYGDVLTISTDAPGDSPHTVSLVEDATGAILAFAPAGPLAIGDVPIGSSGSDAFTVVNQGSAQATVVASVSGGSAFTLADAMLGDVADGSSTQGTISFTPTTASLQSATVSLSVGTGDVLCAPLPKLSVTGRGTNGQASVVPASLDFGLVPCGTQAASRTITLGNTGDAPFDFTAAVAASNFTVSPSTGTVQPSVTGGMPQTLTVTPVAIPPTSSVAPDLYADVLTITTTSAGDAGHALPLHMTASGAILQVSTTGLDFGDVPVSTTAQAQFTITNTGNSPATVSFVNGLSQFVLSPQGLAIGPGTSAGFSGAFTPMTANPYSDSASLAVDAATVLCDPLPGPIALDGQGTP